MDRECATNMALQGYLEGGRSVADMARGLKGKKETRGCDICIY